MIDDDSQILIDSCQESVNTFRKENSEPKQFETLTEEYEEYCFSSETGLIFVHFVVYTKMAFLRAGKEIEDEKVLSHVEEYLLGPTHLGSYEEYIAASREHPQAIFCSQPIPQIRKNGNKRDAYHRRVDYIFNDCLTYSPNERMRIWQNHNIQWISKLDSKILPRNNIQLEIEHFSNLKNIPGSTLRVRSEGSLYDRNEELEHNLGVSSKIDYEFLSKISEIKKKTYHIEIRKIISSSEVSSDGTPKRHSGIFFSDEDRKEFLLAVSEVYPDGFYVKDLRKILKEIFPEFALKDPVYLEDKLEYRTELNEKAEDDGVLENIALDLDFPYIADAARKAIEELSEDERTGLHKHFEEVKINEKERYQIKKARKKIETQLINDGESLGDREYHLAFLEEMRKSLKEQFGSGINEK